MKRREFIGLLGGAAAWPLAARAQQASAMRRGRLPHWHGTIAHPTLNVAAFRGGCSEWATGPQRAIETRWATAMPTEFATLAAELVALAPDVILALPHAVSAVARQATATVPVVFATVADPVGAGFVAAWRGRAATSPGSRISNTALAEMAGAAQGERRPDARRSRSSAEPSTAPPDMASCKIARRVGVGMQPGPIARPREIERAVAAFARGPKRPDRDGDPLSFAIAI